MKYFVSVVLFALAFGAVAQTKMNFSLARKMNDAVRQNTEIAVFVKGDIEKIKAETKRLGGVYKYSAGDVAAIRIPASAIELLVSKDFVARVEDNDYKMQKLCDTLSVHINSGPVHAGFPPLTQGYDGTGVVVGIIDAGIDITHMDFKDWFGNTRISYIWDQTVNNDPGGITPMPYGYGTEWNSIAINNGGASAHQDEPGGHGTLVAGVAVSNGIAVNNYKGVAPGAEIIVVKIAFGTSDDIYLSSVADAVNYIYSQAQAMGMPAVINISSGTYWGSHDGEDLQSIIIGGMVAAQPGRSLAAAAGNIGYAKIHFEHNGTPDTSFIWLDTFGVPASAYIAIYGDTADLDSLQFAMGVDDVSNYSYRGGTAFSNLSSLMGFQSVNVMNGSNRIGIVQSYGDIVGSTFSLEYYIQPDSLPYFWRFMTKGSGHIDAWSFNYVVNNLPIPTDFPLITKYISADTLQNIVGAFQCRDEVMSVGSYNNRNYYTSYNNAVIFDTSFTPGEISGFSSHGPTRDGRIKPDITAPGGNVIASGYWVRVNTLLNLPQWSYLVAAGGKHVIDGGTSMASPAVAGIAALYLQRNPTATCFDVKSAILNCARQDVFTGTNLPDNEWGYGKADAFATLTNCYVGVHDLTVTSGDMIVYPNPSSGDVTVYYSMKEQQRSRLTLRLIDIVSNIVEEISLDAAEGYVKLPLSKFASGVYVMTLQAEGLTVCSKKIVKL
jgi:subtilisin family serine protease